MKRRRSSIALTAALLLGAVITVILFCTAILLISVTSRDDGTFAAYDISYSLQAAIGKDPSGKLIVRDTAELRRHRSDFPGLWYVVSDGQTTVTYGNEPGAARQALAPADPEQRSSFVVTGPKRLLTETSVTRPTDAGSVTIRLGGAVYTAWQYCIAVLNDTAFVVTPVLIILIVTIAAAIGIVPGLMARPVQRVAAAADAVDGMREGVRLPELNSPAELLPIVSAFNRALDRIDAAAAEQRRFLGNAAHELRTPLANVRLKVEDIEDPMLRATVTRDLHSLSSTVTMLLQLARLSSKPLELVRVDLVAISRSCAADHVPLALKKHVRVEFKDPGSPVWIHGSDTSIRTALSNLMRNAFQHGGPAGAVELIVGEDATISVVDHGRGIADRDKEAVLHPFARGTQDGDGTGLGLAIVAQVAALHGGSVALLDTPGGGTTVRLAFVSAASS